MQDKILELEQKIAENKMQLNNIQSDIAYMEQQVNILKGEMMRDVQMNNMQPQVQVQPEFSVQQSQNLPQQNAYVQSQVQFAYQQANNYSQNNTNARQQVQFAYQQANNYSQNNAYAQQQVKSAYQQTNNYPQQPQGYGWLKQDTESKLKSKDMETAVGKTIMGIAASLLIFISLVLFAKLIIPHLTDTIKLVLMYMVSIGITTLGLIKFNKNRDSVLFLSISACGIGSLYISLFLSNVYFNVYNEIVLYVLLFLWAVGVCVLSRLRSEVFHIIGQAGILISVFHGTQFCVQHSDLTKQLIIVIYFIVGSLIFYFTHNNSRKNYVISSGFNILSVIFLYSGLENLEGGNYNQITHNIAMLLLMGYILFKLMLPLFWSGIGQAENKVAIIKKYTNSTGIVNAIYCILSLIMLENLIDSEQVYFGIVIIASAFYLVALEFAREDEDSPAGVNILYLILTVMMGISAVLIDGLDKVFGVAIIALPYLLYGYLKNRKFFRISSILLMIVFTIIPNVYLGMWIVLGAAMLGVAMYFIFTKTEHYNLELKNIMLGVIILFLSVAVERLFDGNYDNWQTSECIRFVLVAITVGVAAKTKYIENPVTKAVEQGTKIFVNLIIGYLMLQGLGAILHVEDVALNVTYIIFTIALFVLNANEQLKDKERRWYGPYVGVKFTVLMVVILSSFEAEGFLVSIFCFIFAIISISVGFFVKHKELRIYGLVLSLISVIKLIMIDMSYNNTLGHALSFFISGVLCFVISAIYASVEKKMSEED